MLRFHYFVVVGLFAATLAVEVQGSTECCVTCQGATYCACGVETACGSCCVGICCDWPGSESNQEVGFHLTLKVGSSDEELLKVLEGQEIPVPTLNEDGYFLRVNWLTALREEISVALYKRRHFLWMSFDRKVDEIVVQDGWEVSVGDEPRRLGPLAVTAVSHS